MFGFFRYGRSSAFELTARFREKALQYLPDPLALWKLTAAELAELIAAGEKRLGETYRANELLAFNTAALTFTAVNAPSRFPRSPGEAFPDKPRDWREAKAEMLKMCY